MPTSHDAEPSRHVPERVFVGRGPELATLRAGLERAIAGRGGVLLMAGEPGIGKSELADQLAREAAACDATVLWGRAWEGEGAPPYWPWAQILRVQIHERSGAELKAIFGAATPYLAQILPEIHERLPDLPAPPPIDAEQARFRQFDAITAFLKSSAATQPASPEAAQGMRPLVLILDDLHWADKPSLLLLRFLAREIADSHLLVLGTYRDVEVSRGHPLAEVLPSLRQERTVERLLVRGLAEDDVRALLAALHGATVPVGLADAISRETEGNPFFIREIVRHLIDEGVIGRDGTTWTSRSRIEDMRLPESVRDVIGRRLGRLSEPCAQLLTAAAVVGREFAVDVLEQVADLDEERLLEVLEEAIAARVIEEVAQRVGRYRFAHALIREALYEGVRRLDRMRRHRRVADVLETLYARNPVPHLAELAHHFLEALPGGDIDKAADYATRAGDRANDQLAYEEAAVHYERALQALELGEQPDERVRCALLLKLGEARGRAGGFERPMDTLRQAGELAERLGDAELLARVSLVFAGPGVTSYSMMLGEECLALLTRAIALLEDRDSALRARVMARQAALLTFLGDAQGMASRGRAAIEMARRVGDKGALAYVLNVTPWAVWGPDNLEERLAVAEEEIRLAGEIGDAQLAGEGHTWKACHLLEIGDIAGSDRETSIQDRFAETSRQAYSRWLAAVSRGGRAVLEGRFEEAERLFQTGSESGRDLRTGLSAAGRGILLHEQQGRAAELLSDFSSYATHHPLSTIWSVALTHIRATLGQTEEARRGLDSVAGNDFADIPRNSMYLFIMSRLCEVVSFLGDSQRAAILYDLLLPYADRCAIGGRMTSCMGSVSRPLGLLATLLSRYEDAEKHFERALEMNARIRARIWVAHTQHHYARMLVARDAPGDREKAAALAAEALATAREVGMKPLAAKVVELQAAAGFGTEAAIELPPEPSPAPAASAVFRRDGDVWAIAYEGYALRLKDAKGLQYIAALLRHAGREFHAADLAATGDTDTPINPAAEGAVARGLGDAGEVLDAQARGEYRQRLEDLRAELEEATRWGDAGRSAKLREEIEFLTDELNAAYGVGGRVRKAGDVANRARKAVTSRIRDAIARIAKEHPGLGRHLENAIRTGVFCSYEPDRSPAWDV